MMGDRGWCFTFFHFIKSLYFFFQLKLFFDWIKIMPGGKNEIQKKT
jgi:hypothetical protein